MISRRFRNAVKKSFKKIFSREPSKPALPVTVRTRMQVPIITPELQLTVPPASPSAATLRVPVYAAKPQAAPEVVVEPDKHFKKSVFNEMMSFKQSSEHFASGAAGFSNSWMQWIGLGAISAGVAVVNATIAVVAALGLILAPVSAGIALAVSIAGVLGGIGFNIYMYRRKRNEYRRAETMLNRDNVEDDMKRIADTLAVVLHDQLLTCTRKEADMLAKASCEVLTHAILKGKIKSFDELTSPAALSELLSTHASFAPRYQFQTKSADNKKQNTRDILKGLVKPEPVITPIVKRDSSTVSASKDERTPLLAAAVSGQSMFVRTNVEQPRRIVPVPPTTQSPRRMV